MWFRATLKFFKTILF